jgi:hypothetical protein
MYNLKPSIADAVRKAVLSFVSSPATQPTGTVPASERNIRFVPVDYAKDFAMVRAIDDAFESRALLGFNKAATKPAN